MMEYVVADKRHSQKLKQQITKCKTAYDNPTGAG
jgi:hypothetical protein